MKTQGIQVIEGYLVFPAWQIVPLQFWHRLKHEMVKAGVLAEFEADYRRENESVRSERTERVWCNDQRLSDFAREASLFRRWVVRLFGPQALWPWERGWTPEAVDEYLDAPIAAHKRSQGPSRGCSEAA